MISYEPLYKMLKEKNMTIRELSEKAGFQEHSLSSMIARHGHIMTDKLSRICEAMNCQPEDIFEFVDEKPEHKRTCVRKDWQYSSEDFVVVNWEKVRSDIKEKGYSMNRMSIEMGKEGCWVSMRIGRKYTKKTVIKQIADFLGKPTEDYL